MILNSFNSLFELFAALNFTYFTIGRKDTRLITLNDNILEYYQDVESTLSDMEKDLDFNKETLIGKKQYYKNENFEIPNDYARIIQMARKSEQPLSIDNLLSDLNNLQTKLDSIRKSVKSYFDRTILPQTFSHASIYASLYCVLILFVGTFHTQPDIYNINEGLSIFNIFSIVFIISCLWFFDYEKFDAISNEKVLHRIKTFFKIINFPKTIFWFLMSVFISLISYKFFCGQINRFVNCFCETCGLNLNILVVVVSLIIPISHFIYYILAKIYWLVLSLFQSENELSQLKKEVSDFKTEIQTNLDMFEELFKHLSKKQEIFEIKPNI